MRLERESEYSARVEEWAQQNKALWEELIPALEGEALDIARTCPANDGVCVCVAGCRYWKQGRCSALPQKRLVLRILDPGLQLL